MATRKLPRSGASDHHLVPASTLEAQVKNAVSELSSSTETLRGLALALDNYGGTNASTLTRNDPVLLGKNGPGQNRRA
jgi:hypothetical protein